MDGEIRVNGNAVPVSFAPEALLLDVLREAGFVEVKEGCREAACGSCLVLLDGELVNSCQVLAASALGREVTTVKGLGTLRQPHPIQEAFAEAGAVQCGFCTPGMVLATHALLRENPDPDEAAIRRGLDGNLCRCTGYVKIVDAVKLAARRLGAAKPAAGRRAGRREARHG
jgi:aerobic-type carbon monoxide dehydrogenase small subunit (CoxS/CutS family)